MMDKIGPGPAMDYNLNQNHVVYESADSMTSYDSDADTIDGVKLKFPSYTSFFSRGTRQDVSQSELIRAYFLLSLCVIFFGVMYAPARKYRHCDGVIFQFIMSIGIVGTGLILQLVSVWANWEHLVDTATNSESVKPSSSSIFFNNLFLVYSAGILGGAFWSISNLFVLVSVKFLGLGVGFTLYHAVNLTIGYCIGRFQLFGVPKEDPKTMIQDLTQFINVASFLLVMNVDATAEAEELEAGRTSIDRNAYADGKVPLVPRSLSRSMISTSGLRGSLDDDPLSPTSKMDRISEQSPISSSGSTTANTTSTTAGTISLTTAVNHNNNSETGKLNSNSNSVPQGLGGLNSVTMSGSNAAAAANSNVNVSSTLSTLSTISSRARAQGATKKMIGFVVGLIAGFFCSINMVPFVKWEKEHKDIPVHLFTLSQTLGIFLTSSIVMLLYYLSLTFIPSNPNTQKVLGLVKRKQLQKTPPLVAALIPGSLWACGFFSSLDGVELLGMGIGYVITAVGPVAVSGIIATLWFDEIHGTKQKAMFWTAISMQAIAQILLISQDKP